MPVDYRVIGETDHFLIAVGALPATRRALPYDMVEKYMVVNKQHGVIEYITEVYYFARTWADQMEDALLTMGKPDVPTFVPPVPNGQIN